MLALIRQVLLGAAGSLLLQFVAGSLGMAGTLVNLLVPVPLALTVMAGGLLAGGLAAFVAFLVLWFAGGPLAMAVFGLQYAAPALVLAGLLRRRVAWEKAVVIGTVTVFLLGVAGLAVYAGSVDRPLMDVVGGYLQSEIDTAMQMGEAASMPPEQLDRYREVVSGLGELLKVTFVGWALLVIEIMMSVQVLLLNRLSRGRYQIEGSEFRRFKTAEWLIWPLIAAGFAAALGSGPVKVAGLNLLIVLLPAYFLQGMAIVAWFFARKGVPPFMRGAGYVLIALVNPLPLLVTGLGVFDLWVDFRAPRLKQKKS
ncbi:MAG: YybS family protein [Geothermobacteraceae bacterium]